MSGDDVHVVAGFLGQVRLPVEPLPNPSTARVIGCRRQTKIAELIAQLAAEDFVARRDDRRRDLRGEPAQRGVGLGGGLLDENRGSDEIRMRVETADRKVGDGACGLDAVVRIRGHLQLTERVAFDARRHRH